jgi:hypothetical protein
MKHLLTGALILAVTGSQAQTWKLNMETGLTISKLQPGEGSTIKSGTLKYGYSQPGMYIAPEVQLKINGHLDASFNYQYANARVGVQHRSYNASINNYDGIAMHSLNLGLYGHTAIFRDRLKIGAFVKQGFSYNKMVMMGSGGSAGGDSGSGAAYSYMSRTSDFDAMSGAWTPVSTVGLSIGPNSKKRLGDRLSFRWAAVLNWENTYNGYSEYDYLISTANGTESGTVKYRGIPFVMQFGVNFRVAGFGRKTSPVLL